MKTFLRQAAGLGSRLLRQPRRLWLGVLGVLLLAYFFLAAVGGFLIYADPLQPADAVIVLGGGQMSRLETGVELYLQGFVDKVVLTNAVPLPRNPFRNPLLLRRIRAAQLGVPPGDLLTTPILVSSTLDEARAALDLAQSQGWQRIIVVSEPDHTRRAAAIFHDTFTATGIEVIIRPVRQHWFTPWTWMIQPAGWFRVATEVVKLTAYLIGLRLD